MEDGEKLYVLIPDGLKETTPPARLALGPIAELKLGEIVSEVKRTLECFET